jgi:hypothetical protein
VLSDDLDLFATAGGSVTEGDAERRELGDPSPQAVIDLLVELIAHDVVAEDGPDHHGARNRSAGENGQACTEAHGRSSR